jgi:hypothetical protein
MWLSIFTPTLPITATRTPLIKLTQMTLIFNVALLLAGVTLLVALLFRAGMIDEK